MILKLSKNTFKSPSHPPYPHYVVFVWKPVQVILAILNDIARRQGYQYVFFKFLSSTFVKVCSVLQEVRKTEVPGQ